MAKRPGAHELIVGLVDDATFGPVVLFGRGGTAVEVIRDKVVGLPPLNRTLAHGLIQRTRVARLMAGYRGRPAADFEAVADTLMKIAEIAADHASVCDLDINPLWADQHGVLALDARLRVRPAAGRGADRFAILPYPKELEARIEDRQGTMYLLRPIRPEDAPGIQKTVHLCDPEDIRMRFFSALRDMPVKLAARLTQIDYDREMAFVAAEPAAAPFEEQEIVGVVRLAMDPDRTRGEYSVIVRSDHKGRGLGYRLMQEIVDFGRSQGLSEIYGDVLRENKPMLDMCGDLGFHRRTAEGDGSVVEVYLPL
jgi:acetyltransferase